MELYFYGGLNQISSQINQSGYHVTPYVPHHLYRLVQGGRGVVHPLLGICERQIIFLNEVYSPVGNMRTVTNIRYVSLFATKWIYHGKPSHWGRGGGGLFINPSKCVTFVKACIFIYNRILSLSYIGTSSI